MNRNEIFTLIMVDTSEAAIMNIIIDRVKTLNNGDGFSFGRKTSATIVIKSDISADTIVNKLLDGLNDRKVELIVMKTKCENLSCWINSYKESVIRTTFNI